MASMSTKKVRLKKHCAWIRAEILDNTPSLKIICRITSKLESNPQLALQIRILFLVKKEQKPEILKQQVIIIIYVVILESFTQSLC